MEAYVKAIAPATSPDRREQIHQELIEYCALDTPAIVKVWEFSPGELWRWGESDGEASSQCRG
jgi:hypothetical protein